MILYQDRYKLSKKSTREIKFLTVLKKQKKKLEKKWFFQLLQKLKM
jgi:hypothetical protein